MKIESKVKRFQQGGAAPAPQEAPEGGAPAGGAPAEGGHLKRGDKILWIRFYK